MRCSVALWDHEREPGSAATGQCSCGWARPGRPWSLVGFGLRECASSPRRGWFKCCFTLPRLTLFNASLLNLHLGYCAFDAVIKNFYPSFVRFLPFGDRGNNANTRRTHCPNLSCLIESALFHPLPVLKFACPWWPVVEGYAKHPAGYISSGGLNAWQRSGACRRMVTWSQTIFCWSDLIDDRAIGVWPFARWAPAARYTKLSLSTGEPHAGRARERMLSTCSLRLDTLTKVEQSTTWPKKKKVLTPNLSGHKFHGYSTHLGSNRRLSGQTLRSIRTPAQAKRKRSRLCHSFFVAQSRTGMQLRPRCPSNHVNWT